MQHVKKIKFRFGRDANRGLVQKMSANLIKFGKVETSLPRAKMLKMVMDRMVSDAQIQSESHKNVLLRKLHDSALVNKLFTEIGPRYKGRVGGFVRIVKVGYRQGDGTLMGRVEWVEGTTPKVVEKTEPVSIASVDTPQEEVGSKKLEGGKVKKAIKVKAVKKPAKKKVVLKAK